MTVRVLRLIEYVYDNHEIAERDMSRWNLAANGMKNMKDMTISSSVLPPRTLKEDEVE